MSLGRLESHSFVTVGNRVVRIIGDLCFVPQRLSVVRHVLSINPITYKITPSNC